MKKTVLCQKQKDYYEKNKEKIRQKQKEYYKIKKYGYNKPNKLDDSIYDVEDTLLIIV
jgi:hypothetical protein